MAGAADRPRSSALSEKQLDGVTVEHLVQSYRSAPEVIGAVNQVMEKLTSFGKESKDAEGFMDWAADFKTHSTAKKDLAGWVTLREATPVEDASGPGKAQTGLSVGRRRSR